MTHKARRLMAMAPLLLISLVAGCVSTGSSASSPSGQTPTADASGPLILQSRFTDAEKGGIEELVKNFNALGQGTVQLNSIPTQTFNSQLPTYLTGSKPPDVYTWYAGQATRDFADQNLLLDLSDVWSQHLTNLPAALRSLSQTADGKEVFIPTGYYWWGVYYFKSDFEKLGVTPPKTWDEFVQVAQKIKAQGVNPLTMGLSDNAWLASAWFDYLDLRINGGQFHIDLLSGKEKYDSPKVKAVLTELAKVLPYFDPSILGLSHNQAMSDFAQGRSAMYLLGAWAEPSVPQDRRDDLAFFQFPIIDPSVPIAEEGPTDGLIASVRTDKPALTNRFLAYVASADAQSALMKGQEGTALAANPEATQALDPLAQQGKAMLESAAQVTQFYNRDAGDAQQKPADSALTRLVAEPTAIDSIATEWQAAAERVRATS
ncbi:ABC transporter substrate-binding protein [Cellulomonas sp. WB94]|uniref:ABC transporter substrate-binding protein n=1 Tax=Cellulomonas sp. WB94 TaxID=2173174 RepID=UPI000D569F39|nr:extracellular solute-binding protein [Cellulomonas sp. WB94]PVU83867.1 ABC transporter substrate-binding protein [Cellulomonas sp. WB94]